VLGIVHRPTGEKPDPGSESERAGRAAPPKHNFIMEMRRYMPGPHARFLSDVQAVSNIREFVEEHPRDEPLRVAYDACLSMLSALRDKHIAIVTRYIIVPSREVRARSRSPEATKRRINLATASRNPQPQGIAFDGRDSGVGQGDKKREIKGTGGTALISFLKQARDETGEPAVEEWTKRFMKRQLKAEGRNDFFYGKPEQPETEEVEVAGLAGTWTMDDEVGGICNY